ncbi:MAG: Peptidase and chymotrypsin/Hap [Modestobacter sp.]|nr:Peptidase and chymotrypsin/Hap [Modestobacter sp.]
MTEHNRPADEAGHGTDRNADAGAGWAPQQPGGTPAQPQPGTTAAQQQPAQPPFAPGQPDAQPTQQFPPAGGPSPYPGHQPTQQFPAGAPAPYPGHQPTQQFPAAPQHQPWPPAGWGTPGYQQPHGQPAAGALPPAFLPPAQPDVPAQPTRRPGRWRLGVAAGLVGAALVGGGAGAGVVALTDDTSVSGASGATAQSVVIKDAQNATSTTAAAAKAAPSVVTLYVSASAGSGSGSGVVLSADGYVLTNNHVVTLDSSTDQATVQVRTSDGTLYDATVVGTDPTSDLAVVKLSGASGLTPATFADSDKVQVGDLAVAIGAPLGLSNTVTDGIISATNRAVATGSDQEQTVIDALQTDAAINPGNSGGPLVNAAGEIIGINTAIASVASSGLPGQQSSQSGNIGVGFAIPANSAKRIAQEIRDTGSATHALLGVSASTASDNASSAVGTGAQLVSVQGGSPAADAGLQAGDVITAVGDRVVTSSTELTAAVRSAQPGDKVTLTIRRGQASSQVEVTLKAATN